MTDSVVLDLLVAAVEPTAVQAQLIGRPPNLLDENSDAFPLYQAEVRGMAVEVLPLAGGRTEGQRWDLAVRAVVLGTAASIESSLFPEQQGLGDMGRARALTDRYERILAQLRGELPGDDGSVDSDGIPAPVGSFPPPSFYPDPVRARPFGVYGLNGRYW